MEVWQAGVASLSSDLLGVRDGLGDRCGPRLHPGEQLACRQLVRTTQKVLDVVSFSGSRFHPHPPFTAKLEQYWENGTGAYNEEPGLFTQPRLGLGSDSVVKRKTRISRNNRQSLQVGGGGGGDPHVDGL